MRTHYEIVLFELTSRNPYEYSVGVAVELGFLAHTPPSASVDISRVISYHTIASPAARIKETSVTQ
jgi:hypothetical protein